MRSPLGLSDVKRANLRNRDVLLQLGDVLRNLLLARLRLGSRKYGCSSKQFWLQEASTWLSTILGMICSGLPSCWALDS